MKFLLLIVLLTAKVLASTENNWYVRNFHRHIVYPLKDAEDNLIYVTFSLDNRRAIQIDFHGGKKPCVVPHYLNFNSRSHYKVAVLGNGQIVTTMLNKQMTRPAMKDKMKNQLVWKLSIIDPKNCSYQHRVIGAKRRIIKNILPYMDAFDLDVKEHRLNLLMRVKDDGNFEGFPMVIPDEKYIGIRIAEEYNSNQGFYYVVPKDIERYLVLKKLDVGFKVSKSYIVNRNRHSYDQFSYSVTYGRITFCYFIGNRINIECIVIDSELTHELLKVQLTSQHEMYDMMVLNCQQNGFAIIHVHFQDNGASIVYARRVSETGKVGSLVTVGQVNGRLYKIYGFVMKNGQLGIVVAFGDAVYSKIINLK